MSSRPPRPPLKTTAHHGKPAHAHARKLDVMTRQAPASVATIAEAEVVMDRDVYMICERDGSLLGKPGMGHGLYYHDCRYLHKYTMTLNGEPLQVLAAAARNGCKALFQLTNHDLPAHRHQSAIQRQDLAVRLSRLASGEHLAIYDAFELRNYADKPMELCLELAFDADFADVFTIRGLVDLHPGKRRPPCWEGDTLRLGYDGKDGVFRAVDVSFSRRPTWRGSHGACFRIALDPGEELDLVVSLALTECVGQAPPCRDRRPPLDELERALQEAGDRWVGDRHRVATNAPLFDRIYGQCFRDLHTLRMELDGLEFLAAGVPWFGTLFGRDSLIAAMQMMAYDRELAPQTLRLLARYQGRDYDAWRDEQPGKILHELRMGELARLDEIPHTPYYGTIDATPLFLIVLADHARWTGRLDLFEELRPAVEAALEWIQRSLRHGYLVYDSQTEHLRINQGWKDAGNSILNADGSQPDPPIALVEVQGYVYRAWRDIAQLYERAGEPAHAGQLREQAEDLKERFNRDFWLADDGYFALALQAGQRPVAVISSNPGQALWTGIVDEERAAQVARRLLRPDMFSGWGVRTLSRSERPFNPVSYHLGTVWPHDNALIAAGLRRYGFDAEAASLHAGIFDAASHFDLYRMPEVFSGFNREPFGEPVRYPVACHPQAWAAGALPHLLVTMLGLEPDAFERKLVIRRPQLLELVTQLELTNLRVGEASVDLKFRRQGHQVSVDVMQRHGKLTIQVEQ